MSSTHITHTTRTVASVAITLSERFGMSLGDANRAVTDYLANDVGYVDVSEDAPVRPQDEAALLYAARRHYTETETTP